jgi:hypothetical protein
MTNTNAIDRDLMPNCLLDFRNVNNRTGRCSTAGLFIAVALLLCACTPATFEGNLYIFGILDQPESPLIPGTNPTLTDYDWQLLEITFRNEKVSLDGLEPFYLYFDETGFLGMRSDKCLYGAYRIVAISATQYRLLPTVSPAVGCSIAPEVNQRLWDIGALVALTNEYVLASDELVLTNKIINHEIEAIFVAISPENVLFGQ